VLRDIKGRNRAANPRRHLLPIVAELAPIITRRRALCQTADAPLFSATGAVALREEPRPNWWAKSAPTWPRRVSWSAGRSRCATCAAPQKRTLRRWG